jgi:competence protein ComGF
LLAGNSRLEITSQNGDLVTYRVRNHILVRKVNGRGNVWLLQHVKQANFTRIGRGISIAVTGTEGRTYERVFLSYADQSE